MGAAVGFRAIDVNRWQEFCDATIKFHPRLTVITGANGSGKTTMLRLLARHPGWEYYQLRTPYPDQKTGFRHRIVIQQADRPRLDRP